MNVRRRPALRKRSGRGGWIPPHCAPNRYYRNQGPYPGWGGPYYAGAGAPGGWYGPYGGCYSWGGWGNPQRFAAPWLRLSAEGV